MFIKKSSAPLVPPMAPLPRSMPILKYITEKFDFQTVNYQSALTIVPKNPIRKEKSLFSSRFKVINVIPMKQVGNTRLG